MKHKRKPLLSLGHIEQKYKKSAGILLGTLAISCSVYSAETKASDASEYPFNAVAKNGVNGQGGSNGAAGGSGSAAYTFTAPQNSSPQNNVVTINDGVAISGGNGGSGSHGGTGSTGGAGEPGGIGGVGGDGTDGGLGASGISANFITIDNKGRISGGNGGRGGNGGNGGDGGNGTVNGGPGGNGISGSTGSSGGEGITGNNLIVKNASGSVIAGGNGGDGGNGGNGGNGGTANNSGKGGNGGNGANGSNGGVAIAGNNLTINNQGNISGGNGGAGGNGGTGATGGNGGAGGNGAIAISGNSLTITNAGSISGGLRGAGGTAGTNGVSGAAGNNGTAIQFAAGTNALTLQTGSQINGDIALTDVTGNVKNSLSLTSDAATTVTGGLIAGSGTNTTISGNNLLTFTDSASFGVNSSLTFSGTGGFKASDVTFSDGSDINASITGISVWNQNNIALITTDDGITFVNPTDLNNITNIKNTLLTDGAKDYAGIQLTPDHKVLGYGLKWNNTTGDGYGTFDLKKDATLNLGVVLADNTSPNSNSWDGKTLTKMGEGTLILSSNNTYTGETQIQQGTLKTGITNAFSNTSAVTIGQNGVLNLGANSQGFNNNQTMNKASPDDDVQRNVTLTNKGTILINDLNAALSRAPVVIGGNINNSGTVVINNCSSCAGQTLEVTGDWIGNGGTVSLGTVLGGDNSLTDQLIIGGNATGLTYVSVMNEGGSGAQTLEGIKIIETGSSTAGAFAQSGRIVAGSYDYTLGQGTGLNSSNWYLTSKLNNGTKTFRPEMGSYSANLAAASTLFNTQLSDRQGRNFFAGEQNPGHFWGRIVGGHSKANMSDGQSSLTANRVVFQVGGDIKEGTRNGSDAWNVGLMAGYGSQYSKTRNGSSGYQSKGDIHGYSMGGYGTWHEDAQEKIGLYADSWMIYSWFNNSVKGDDLSYEGYTSQGLTASVESGYLMEVKAFTTESGTENRVFVKPQAQVIWSGVRANGHTEQNGTLVQGKGQNNVQARLGMRVSVNSQFASQESNSMLSVIEPYAEVNWLHTTKDYGVKMGDASSHIQGGRNVAELKAGVEGRATDRFSVWGNVSQGMGDSSYRDTSGMMGMKYAF